MQPTLDPSQNPTLDMHLGPQSSQLPSFSATGILPVVFTIVFIIWVLYSVVIAYHWFRYGRNSWFAVPTMVAHLAVSAVIILFMASGLA